MLMIIISIQSQTIVTRRHLFLLMICGLIFGIWREAIKVLTLLTSSLLIWKIGYHISRVSSYSLQYLIVQQFEGSIRLIDLRQSALCDSHSKFYGTSTWTRVHYQRSSFVINMKMILYIFDKFECCLSEEWLQVLTGAESPGGDANGNSFDHTTKLLHLAWHPTENSIACLRPTVCTYTMLEEKKKHPQMEKEALATCETE
ncbi:hypothetical protein IGI04_003036 [Brassica rapa subsp. trilocularis]|uniref:Uncharacterized protein n=1 Tax=Brassica rapa subsp. trilocularis TaxID=1813537 RepID=A0ABQ7P0N5_BRACM|nr:hypothetical protein IGI04_003036 [Brassica rapa subsp. trilocularis]